MATHVNPMSHGAVGMATTLYINEGALENQLFESWDGLVELEMDELENVVAYIVEG